MGKKEITSGILIVAAIIGIWFLFEIIAFLAWALLPLLILVGALYLLGQAPKGIHDAVEKKIREGLDWLDFKAPSWTWPFIKAARNGLDWLGIHVKQNQQT